MSFFSSFQSYADEHFRDNVGFDVLPKDSWMHWGLYHQPFCSKLEIFLTAFYGLDIFILLNFNNKMKYTTEGNFLLLIVTLEENKWKRY